MSVWVKGGFFVMEGTKEKPLSSREYSGVDRWCLDRLTTLWLDFLLENLLLRPEVFGGGLG